MKRALAYTGAAVSVGFLGASAVINYSFGFRMGRSLVEQHTLGLVAILAVAMNALCPFYIQWARNRAGRASAVLLWSLCVAYTIASAIGFAAENTAEATGIRAAQHDNLKTVQAMLDDELAKKKRDSRRVTQLRERIMAYRDKGASIEPDNQARLIARIVRLPTATVRTGLIILFAFLIEIGAALGLYISLAHLEHTPADPSKAATKSRAPTPSRRTA